jgi:hypothetical protein
MEKKTDLKDCCAYCEVTNCINLFRHENDDSELVGGELYVYKLLAHPRIKDQGLDKHICSNGVLLQCACFIVGPLYEKIPQDYLTNISNEIVRDMKASFYLAMSGHYRQAILIQRCVLENFLYGLYFHAEDYVFSKSKNGQRDINAKFMHWLSGGFRKSCDYLLDITQRGRLISIAEKKECRTLFKGLSQFVHTILKTPTGKTIKYGSVEIKSCYSEVEFDKESLIEWSRYYQKLLFFILYKLITIYPTIKKEDGGKLALRKIIAEFKDVKEELNNPHLNELLKMKVGKFSNSKTSVTNA